MSIILVTTKRRQRIIRDCARYFKASLSIEPLKGRRELLEPIITLDKYKDDSIMSISTNTARRKMF